MRIILFGDAVAESGFGRLSNEIGKRLVARGHQIIAAGINYSGWPINGLVPYHVYPLAGRDIWAELGNIIAQHTPEMVICVQDFPYSVTAYRALKVNWSKIAFLAITPIDGFPIEPDWLDLVDDIDGTMVISRFGVEAMRQAGKRVGLCHPGVDTGHFKPATIDERKALRAQAGIAADAFVIGMFAMNQGRKNIPATLVAFHEFAKDKPQAQLLLDMEPIGAGGFDIAKVCKQNGFDASKLIFRHELIAKGLTSLRDRYCLLDVHSVISFREGFGLPLLESQACGIPAVALDWCSGTEICGEGKGVLIPRFGPGRIGTWGGAMDYDPDMPALLAAYEKLYAEPGYRGAVAEAGYRWAIQQTWDNAAQAVDLALTAALAKHKAAYGAVTEEAYSAIGKRDYSGVQPAAVRDEVRQQPGVGGIPGDAGDYPGGRLQPGLQPGGAAGAAVQGAARGDEPGLRGDVQPRGVSVLREAAVLPELGHAGAAGLARANGAGV